MSGHTALRKHTPEQVQAIIDRDIARGKIERAGPDLLAALRELLEQIDCLGGIEFSKDLEPYKAEAVWDDALRRASAAIKSATGATHER